MDIIKLMHLNPNIWQPYFSLTLYNFEPEINQTIHELYQKTVLNYFKKEIPEEVFE
jgi:hypothetical protein